MPDIVATDGHAYPPLAVGSGHDTRRFTTCTDSPAAARSTLDALTFRAVTRTLLFDQTWQSSTKAMPLFFGGLADRGENQHRQIRPSVDREGRILQRNFAQRRMEQALDASIQGGDITCLPESREISAATAQLFPLVTPARQRPGTRHRPAGPLR